MRRLFWIMVAAPIAVATAAGAKPLTCREWATEYRSLVEGKKTGEDLSREFWSSSGLLLGRYYTLSGEKIASTDQGRLSAFEEAAIAACSRRPGEWADAVILETAVPEQAAASKVTEASSDRPGYSPYPDLKIRTISVLPGPALTRVRFAIANDRDALASASVRCDVRDGSGALLGVAAGWANNLPPHQESAGEAFGDFEKAATADCRIMKARDGTP